MAWQLILGISLPLLLAVLTPLAAGLTADRVARANSKARKQRALERIQRNPMAHPNARINRLLMETGGGLEFILQDCYIDSISLDYVSIMSMDGKKALNFTVEEFEKMHPIYDVEPESNDTPKS